MNKNKSKFLTLIFIVMVCTFPTLLKGQTASDTTANKQQLTGNENHVITLDQAIKYVQQFRSKRTAPAINGGFFGKNIFGKILSQSGCVGLRYYYAQKDDGTPTIVLVGVDSTGSDLVQGVIAEEAMPCPPICGVESILNK